MSTHHDSHDQPADLHGNDSHDQASTEHKNESPTIKHQADSLHPIVNAVIAVFSEQSHGFADSTKYQVSRTVSLLAGFYEKARNAVEFRAEHLIRRAAIERILKRRILIGGTTNTMAEHLIVELLWARYIDSSQINDKKVQDVQKIIDKYLVVKFGIYNNKQRVNNVSWDIMLGLMSSEIEECISPAKKREALNNFVYQAILPKIHIPEEDEKSVSILTYIAVERSFAQSDDPLILFHIIKLIQPSWFEISPQEVNSQINDLFNNILQIEKSLKHRLSERLFRFVRKHNPPFLLLRDFFLEKGSQTKAIIEDEALFEQTLATIAARRYKETGKKVSRAVVRSIIYIFLTKMVFALALEVPVDLFITKKIDYLSVAINMLFPPLLLFAIAGFLKVPGEDNTRRLISNIKGIIYSFDTLKDEVDQFTSQPKERRPVLTAVFTLFYLATFLVSFGFISYILTLLHFNVASQIIFIFFVTLVSFFAYRIRLSAKEYELLHKPGHLTPIIDFFFLPILRVGRALSSEIAKLNVFMFIFDFILEAPLKVIFEFMEEWFRFIRSKKDEII
jgi:hypothetical protein